MFAGYVVTGNKDLERVRIFSFFGLFIFFGILTAIPLTALSFAFGHGMEIWNSVSQDSNGSGVGNQVPPYFFIGPLLVMIAFLARGVKK